MGPKFADHSSSFIYSFIHCYVYGFWSRWVKMGMRDVNLRHTGQNLFPLPYSQRCTSAG